MKMNKLISSSKKRDFKVYPRLLVYKKLEVKILIIRLKRVNSVSKPK